MVRRIPIPETPVCGVGGAGERGSMGADDSFICFALHCLVSLRVFPFLSVTVKDNGTFY